MYTRWSLRRTGGLQAATIHIELCIISVIYFQLKYDAFRKADPNCKKLSPTAKHQKYCEAASEIMSPIVASVRPLHPPKVWEDISPQFLVTFWSLTMYDLFVPNDSYQREINKIKQLSLQVMDSKDMVRFIFLFTVIIIIGIQPLDRFGQRTELSQAIGIALVRCILDKFFGVGCQYFPPLFRHSHFCHQVPPRLS